MARSFDGAIAQIICSPGVASQSWGTYMAIFRTGTDSGSRNILQIRDGAGGINRGSLVRDSTTFMAARWSGTIVAPSITHLAADGWVFVAACKETGNVICRFHKYVYSTNTWTHENSVTTSSNVTNTWDAYHIGHRVSDQRWNGGIAAVGHFGLKTFTDAELEAGFPFSAMTWLGYSNSASTIHFLDAGDVVNVIAADLSGNGANQTSITTTTLSTTMPPFNWGSGVMISDESAAGAVFTGGTLNSKMLIQGVGR